MNVVVENFWNQVIDGYYRHDIKELESIKPDSKEYGLCAVPQFLCVCSVLELLAKLLRDGEKLNTGDNVGAWQYYFTKYLPEIADLVNPIQDLGRNGSAHLFLPKYISIAKRPENQFVFNNINGRPELNVSEFTKLFTTSLDRVKAALEASIDLQERLSRNLNSLTTDHTTLYDKHKDDISKYLTNVPIEVSTVKYHSTETPNTTMMPPP